MSRANILVNLKHNAKKAKNEIKKNLQEVDNESVRPSFDIDDKGQIKELEAKLTKLSRKREAEIEPEIDKKKLAQVEAQLKGLGGGGIGSPEDFESFGGLDSQGNRGTRRLKSVDIDKASIKEMGVSRDDIIPDLHNRKDRQAWQSPTELGFNTEGGPRGLFTKGKRPGSDMDPDMGVDAEIFDGIKERLGPFERGEHGPTGAMRRRVTQPLGEKLGPEFGFRTSDEGVHVGGGESAKRGVRRHATLTRGEDGIQSSMGSFTTPDIRSRTSLSETLDRPNVSIPDTNMGEKLGPRRPNPFEKVSNGIRNFSRRIGDSNGKIRLNALSMGRMKKQMAGFGRKLKGVLPNMSTWYNLFALLLPVIATLAVQLAGVAVAMGTVAAAGASLIGLGLIGHGESLSEAFDNAGDKVDELKKGLFDTFKPALQTFAPISDEFMKNLPQRVEPLVEPLKGLTVFEDSFIKAFNGLVNWTGDVINTLVSYSAELDQLSMRFGSLLGEGLLKVLRWLIEYSFQNQDAMLELYGVFRSIIGTVWTFIKTLSILLAMLRPLFEAIHRIVQLLDNRWGQVLVLVTAAVYILVGALTSLISTFLIMQQAATAGFFASMKAGIMGVVGAINVLITKLAAATGLSYGLAAALAATGVGAIVVGGYLLGQTANSAPGMERSRARTSGGETIVNNDITVRGDDARTAARDIEGLDGWYQGQQDEEDAKKR